MYTQDVNPNIPLHLGQQGWGGEKTLVIVRIALIYISAAGKI